MKRSTMWIAAASIALLALPFVAQALDVPDAGPEFDPCFNPVEALESGTDLACLDPVHWVTQRAQDDRELREILNRLEWRCASDPIVLKDGGEWLVIASLACGVDPHTEAP